MQIYAVSIYHCNCECDLKKHFCFNYNQIHFYFVIPSPRFELPMGAAEQPPLPQQIQSQQKVFFLLLFFKILVKGSYDDF